MALVAAISACSDEAPDSDGGVPRDAASATRPTEFDGLLACWFSMPRAVEVGGRTWAGGVESAVVAADRYDDPLAALEPDEPGGNVYAVENRVDTRYLLMESDSDDHNNPSFLLHPDKPPVVFITEHGADDVVSYRVGTTPLDLSTLGPIRHITYEGHGSHTSYSQTWAQPGTDRVVCLSRLTDPGAGIFTAPRFWSVSVSEDWCETWQPAQKLVHFGDQGYLITAQEGNILHAGGTRHPTHDVGQAIFYVGLDLESGAVIDAAGEVLGNFLTGEGLPLDYVEDTMPVSPAQEPMRTWMEATGVGPSIVWSEWDQANDPNGGHYRHARWDGSAWRVTTIVESGGMFSNFPLLNDIEPQPYRGGASIDADGHVWLSRREGSTWSIERWEERAEGWTLAETVASSDEKRLVRPYCPVGHGSGPRVTWHEVSEYASPYLYISSLHFEEGSPAG